MTFAIVQGVRNLVTRVPAGAHSSATEGQHFGAEHPQDVDNTDHRAMALCPSEVERRSFYADYGGLHHHFSSYPHPLLVTYRSPYMRG